MLHAGYSSIETQQGDPFWLMLIGVPFAMLLLGAALAERRHRLRPPAIFALMGEASFATYLVHSAVISALCGALHRRAQGLLAPEAAFGLILVTAMAVLQVRLFADGDGMLPLIGSGGVDIFFVLSGFVIWHTAEQAPVWAVEFLRRRVVRIVPLYWAMSILALAIAGIAPTLVRSTVFDLRHAIASLMFVPWRNPALTALNAKELLVPVIVPGWTVNFEMMFYLLFALTLRSAGTARLLLLGSLLLGLYLVSGMAGAGTPPTFYHQGVLFEFLAGSILGAMRLERRPVAGVVAFGLVAAGFAVSLGAEAVIDPSVPRILWLGVPAVAIMIGALRAEAAGVVPSWPLLNALGNA